MTSEREDHDNWRESIREDTWRNVPYHPMETPLYPTMNQSGLNLFKTSAVSGDSKIFNTTLKDSRFSPQLFGTDQSGLNRIPALEARVANLEAALEKKKKECEALKGQILMLECKIRQSDL
ncbi:unnamed protein product [marine sediment metagenome]|uniref:Uncharacterized protein n=1 Tax=marine sediment metagenome TaxID=412755 RepID=X0RF10_9ZZZZ